MAFSTPAFVFAFLPVVYILHLIIRNQTARNLLLLIASLLFYSAGSLTHLPLLIGVALVNYLAGLLFRKRVRFSHKYHVFIMMSHTANSTGCGYL